MFRLCRSVFTAAFMAAGFTGCQQNVYEIELTPEGSAFKRELTVWREDAGGGELRPLPDDELSAIAAAYPKATAPEKAAAKKYAFAGTFLDYTPNDVGGFGWFERWETSLGSTAVYVERFRGEDDLAAHLEHRRAAVDRLIELIVGWIDVEFAGLEGHKELREFAGGPLRRDAWNLSLYSWAYGIAPSTADVSLGEPVARIATYLIEHDYLQPELLPTWTRAIADAEERKNYAPLLKLVRETLAAKLELRAEQFPALLAKFDDAERVQASLDKFLKGTPEYKQLHAQWQKDHSPDDAEATPPKGDAVLGPYFLAAYLPTSSLLVGGDQLLVKLAAKSVPLHSNGQWNEEQRAVRWNRPIARRQPTDEARQIDDYPTLLYAAWSEPNEAEQKKHFGRVVLQGNELARYCLWYAGLNMQEAGQWDRFLAGLRPGPELIPALQAFRFDGEPKEEEAHPRLADEIIDALVNELSPP